MSKGRITRKRGLKTLVGGVSTFFPLLISKGKRKEPFSHAASFYLKKASNNGRGSLYKQVKSHLISKTKLRRQYKIRPGSRYSKKKSQLS